VVIPHESIANHSVDCRQHYGLSSRDKALQFSSFNFDASFEQILPALISGAALVVRDDQIWSTKEFCSKLVELDLTVADIPTAYWHQLTEEWHQKPESIPNHSLRLVIVGGEALSPEKLALWQELDLKNVRLVNAYGPTETTITATSYSVPPLRPGERQMHSVPIGRPRGNRKVYILDSYGNPVPVGVPGELHIGGGMLARGYHNRQDLTQSKFITDPFSDAPESRLYKTGDLARYLEDGNIEFLGRLDDQVKIRGFRIELGEVENALREHPQVAETIVLARESAGEKRLVAYITAAQKMPTERELRHFLRGRLPEYMVPAAFVVLTEWPLLPNGKIDRRALPEPEEQQMDGNITGPRDPIELQLQLVFERVLRRAPIGVDVSFFELGGDSLQALELLVEVEKTTGKQLPLGTLYQSSTIESLAREVRDRSSDGEWSALVPMQTGGKKTPLYFIHTTPGDILGYGNLVYRLGPEQPCYGFQSVGLKESSLSQTDIVEMAKYYVDLLRKFQSKGPYHLAGWCYGGVVAVEMARILREMRQEVGLLALLETVAMPPKTINLRYYAHRLNCFLKMAPTQWAVYVREKVRYARDSRMANRMRFRQIDGTNRVTPAGEILDPRLAQLEHVYNTNLAALSHYRTASYDGKVTLFNAADRDLALIKDDQYGWVGLAREIEIHPVPGNHDTMLTEPNVSVLAQKLNDCLKQF
jgi:thioesterase domain-containing protein/acyl carrier protein